MWYFFDMPREAFSWWHEPVLVRFTLAVTFTKTKLDSEPFGGAKYQVRQCFSSRAQEPCESEPSETLPIMTVGLSICRCTGVPSNFTSYEPVQSHVLEY